MSLQAIPSLEGGSPRGDGCPVHPLRVLMVSDVDPVHVIGGAERMLNEHSTRLAARGHRLVVLTRRENPEYPEEEEFRGVRVVRHPMNDNGGLGGMRSILREGGAAFARLAREERFDLINVHQPLAGAAVIRRPESRAVPILYTYLSPWGDEYRIRAGKRGAAGRAWVALNALARERMERSVLRRARVVMALSSFTTTQLHDIHGIPLSEPVVIPGGVDTKRFRPAPDRPALRRELGLPDGFLMLTVRNLVPRMGLDALVAAMGEVVKQRPDVHLAVGGTGELREALDAQTRALGIARNVSFLGFISHARLADYYGVADLFVLPTRTLEGFGLVTVEALACGTPAIGTPIGGTLDILRPLGDDWFFPGLEAGQLSEGLLRRIPQVERQFDLRSRCRTYAVERYAWDAVMPQVERLMSRVAGRAVALDSVSDSG